MDDLHYDEILKIVLKTCGLAHHGGVHTADEVEKLFDVDPRKYPKLFKIYRNDLVSVTDYARNMAENHFAHGRRMNDMLTSRRFHPEHES